MSPDRRFGVLVVLLLGVPLIAMALLPLADTSEPRYAEIARLMAESGDWITPWFAPDVPFWGKPPLSFWAQAASLRLLGTSDIVPRLPSWLVTALALWLLYRCVEQVYDRTLARRAVIIYASCALVFVTSAAVLTDPFLSLGTMLCMTGVLMASRASGWFWRYSFFLGLSVGLLAKGPLVLVLAGGAMLPWYLGFRSARASMRALPWASGIALTLLLAGPWYVAAEWKTPGFLDYFLVGEHVRRFLDPGWVGDRYGSAHQAVYGTIWFYWLQATFPWGLYALARLLCALRNSAQRRGLRASLADNRVVYFAGWALVTPLFFTFSGNILWTYLLPSLAGFSVLTALAMPASRSRSSLGGSHTLLALPLFAPLAVTFFMLGVWHNPMLLKTEKGLVNYVDNADAPAPLVYLDELPFSARFYSRNTAEQVSEHALQDRLSHGGALWVAVPREHAARRSLLAGFTPVFENRRFLLLFAAGRVQNQLASKATDSEGLTKRIQ